MTASNLAFVTAAYTVTWVVLVGYLVRVHRALARARADYERATGEHAEGTP